MKKIEFLILIPCRSGSRGIKGKNFIKIRNKMLFEYSLMHANFIKKKFKSSLIAITTDNLEILNKKFKNTFLIPRPQKISQDKSRSIEFVLHALNFFKRKFIFENIIILQPTCPIRKKADLIKAVKMFKKRDNNCNSLISVYKESYINKSVTYKKKRLYGFPIDKSHNLGLLRQNHEPYFVRNGSIYITSANFLNTKRLIVCKKPLVLTMNKFHSFNIDTPEDLEIVKKLIY